jgi:hypothetical protein
MGEHEQVFFSTRPDDSWSFAMSVAVKKTDAEAS